MHNNPHLMGYLLIPNFARKIMKTEIIARGFVQPRSAAYREAIEKGYQDLIDQARVRFKYRGSESDYDGYIRAVYLHHETSPIQLLDCDSPGKEIIISPICPLGTGKVRPGSKVRRYLDQIKRQYFAALSKHFERFPIEDDRWSVWQPFELFKTGEGPDDLIRALIQLDKIALDQKIILGIVKCADTERSRLSSKTERRHSENDSL